MGIYSPALFHDRVSCTQLDDESNTPLIDQLHHAMQLWKEEKRGDLVKTVMDSTRRDGLEASDAVWDSDCVGYATCG